MMLRRTFLGAAATAALGRLNGRSSVRITGFELLPVKATERTVWLLTRLRTDSGLTGHGEASDAFGFAGTSKADASRMESELRKFYSLVAGKSPLAVEAYRQTGEPAARRGGLISATAYSAIEQALWDLSGQALGVPVSDLFGGQVRATLPVYANINRATSPRTPAGFADAARRAVAEGFRSVKAAPFDGFPKPGSSTQEIDAAVARGIECVAGMRDAVGSEVEVMIDCHSFFNLALAKEVAARLEPYRLAWYEEPVAPEHVDEMAAIRRGVRQPMAGGELMFGVTGFVPLCRARAVDVIMPDVKHCGGLLELSRIAAVAAADGIAVAPHNPSGPVSTAASAQVSAGMRNFRILELQWGETRWRSELTSPPEEFRNGTLALSARPGFGIKLNERLLRSHLL